MVPQELVKEYLLLKKKAEAISQLPAQDLKLRMWVDHPAEFYIRTEDFERDTPKERAYMYKYKATILKAFNNRCAICLAHDKGIEQDHFLIPKISGGNFGLHHRSGLTVNNAVPLCVPCNRRKKDKSYKLFCTEEQIIRIRDVNSMITQLVNNMTP